MTQPCEILEQQPQPILFVRLRTPVEALPGEMGKAYAAIGQYLGRLGQYPAGPPYAAYYNMDMQDLDVEIGLPVAEPVPARGDIQAGQMPGGRAAACLHIGPYSALQPTYDALMAFIEEQGLKPTGVAYEIYLDDPGQTPEEERKTQILFPLK